MYTRPILFSKWSLCVSSNIQGRSFFQWTARLHLQKGNIQLENNYCNLSMDLSKHTVIWRLMVEAGLYSNDEKTVRSILRGAGLTTKMASAIWTANSGWETNGSINWRHLVRQNFESTSMVESMSSTVRFLSEMLQASTDWRCLVIEEMWGKAVMHCLTTTTCNSPPMTKTMTWTVAATALSATEGLGGTSAAIIRILMVFMTQTLTVKVYTFSGEMKVPVSTTSGSQRWSYAVIYKLQAITLQGKSMKSPFSFEHMLRLLFSNLTLIQVRWTTIIQLVTPTP